MSNLQYTVIHNKSKYNSYCDKLELLLSQNKPEFTEEIELLTLLIDHFDQQNNSFKSLNPVEIIKALMTENNLRAKDLAALLELSKGTVSKILNYQKGLSKNSIRKISAHFNISQKSLNKAYPINQTHKNVG